ncbi:MAG: hypothetical protein ACRCVU_16410, partial [Flavobacterium sp.]
MVDKVVVGVKKIVEEKGEDLLIFFEKVSVVVKELSPLIGDLFVAFLDTITDIAIWMTPFITWLGDVLSNVSDEEWANFAKTIVQIYIAFKLMSGLYTVGKFLSGIPQAMRGIGNAIKIISGTTKPMAAFGKGFASMCGKVAGGLKKIPGAGAITRTFTGWMPGVGAKLAGFGGTISTTVAGWGTTIGGSLSGVGSTIATAVGGIGVGTAATFAAAAVVVGAAIVGGWDELEVTAENAIADFQQSWDGMFSYFKEGKYASGIIEGVDIFWDRLLTMFANIPVDLTKGLYDAVFGWWVPEEVNTFFDGVHKGISDGIQKIKNIPDKLASFFAMTEEEQEAIIDEYKK